MAHFDTCGNHGFHICFENGYTISVQFGPGNYCEQYDASFDAPKSQYFWQSNDAEVAVMYKGEFVTSQLLSEIKELEDHSDGQVISCVTPNEVAKIIAVISAWPKQSEEE